MIGRRSVEILLFVDTVFPRIVTHRLLLFQTDQIHGLLFEKILYLLRPRIPDPYRPAGRTAHFRQALHLDNGAFFRKSGGSWLNSLVHGWVAGAHYHYHIERTSSCFSRHVLSISAVAIMRQTCLLSVRYLVRTVFIDMVLLAGTYTQATK